jgi:two-component system chemotaxis response regulator CheY
MAAAEKKKILAVDDSLVALKVLKKLLAGTEFEIAGEAREGKKATELYQSLSPDVVLLDIVMPDISGMEVLGKLQAMDRHSRIIIVSSLGTKEKVMECLKQGAKSFLMKPIDREELLQALRQALEED